MVQTAGELLIPFNAFTTQAGTGVDWSDIGALRLRIDVPQEGNFQINVGSFDATPIPEPASLVLLAAGSLLMLRRERRQ